ncbi:hypothetical protein ABZ863_12750 [Saccharomonospora sp. NPDC046836]|uniref:hypothetical protein n=1 Tax=Saccharomonospora sp. NPDC046836 TaxID=3156921 RepID=UPI0033D156BE
MAHHLTTVVLEAAWRRTITEHCQRILQAVEDSPTDVLANLVASTEVVDEAWRRYRRSLDGATRGPYPLPEAA